MLILFFPSQTLISTLTDFYSEFRVAIAHYLGFGRTSGLWTSDQTADIEAVLRSGLRNFYFPPAMLGVPKHVWNFLRPTAGVTTVAEEGDYELPYDFGGMEGPLTYLVSNLGYTVTRTSETNIRERRQYVVTSGRPQLAAVRPKAGTGHTTAQRFELMLWPTPDAEYRLLYRYAVRPESLTTTRAIPLGGPEHSETILLSCLAVAERRINDAIGPQSEAFKAALLGSIQHDQRLSEPDYYGPNLDRSLWQPSVYDREAARLLYSNYTVTHNGV